ncbi:MAG: hypothetical protein ACFWTZ_09460 [Burkholderia sp.]|jgi:hypothetical protein
MFFRSTSTRLIAAALAASALLSGCALFGEQEPQRELRYKADLSYANNIAQQMDFWHVRDSVRTPGSDMPDSTKLSENIIQAVVLKPGQKLPEGTVAVPKNLTLLIRPEYTESKNHLFAYMAKRDYGSRIEAQKELTRRMERVLQRTAEKEGFKQGSAFNTLHGTYGRVGYSASELVLVDPARGCPAPQSVGGDQKSLCSLTVFISDRDEADAPAVRIPLWIEPAGGRYWKFSRTAFLTLTLPDKAKVDSGRLFRSMAAELPSKTWIYLAPAKTKLGESLPAVLDASRAHYFVMPRLKAKI